MPGHPPSQLCTMLYTLKGHFPDKFNYDLTSGVIDRKLSGDRLLFRAVHYVVTKGVCGTTYVYTIWNKHCS